MTFKNRWETGVYVSEADEISEARFGNSLYVLSWKERERKRNEFSECEYCHNQSGIMDARGNCVSCGAPMPKVNTPLVSMQATTRGYDW